MNEPRPAAPARPSVGRVARDLYPRCLSFLRVVAIRSVAIGLLIAANMAPTSRWLLVFAAAASVLIRPVLEFGVSTLTALGRTAAPGHRGPAGTWWRSLDSWGKRFWEALSAALATALVSAAFGTAPVDGNREGAAVVEVTSPNAHQVIVGDTGGAGVTVVEVRGTYEPPLDDDATLYAVVNRVAEAPDDDVTYRFLPMLLDPDRRTWRVNAGRPHGGVAFDRTYQPGKYVVGVRSCNPDQALAIERALRADPSTYEEEPLCDEVAGVTVDWLPWNCTIDPAPLPYLLETAARRSC